MADFGECVRPDENMKKRLIRSMYALAVADAVGNPFEFLHRDEFSKADVIHYADNATELRISDDTQMTLFGFEALSRFLKGQNITEKLITEFTKSYVEWYLTQTTSLKTESGLRSFDSMFHIEAPGNTCMSACQKLSFGIEPVNDSNGCGAIMKLLPVFGLSSPLAMGIKYNSGKIANITHKSPKARDSVYAIIKYVNEFEYLDPITDITDIEHIGGGWDAETCGKMSIWAFEKSNTYEELLVNSIWHSGDSDSVAAVSGMIWGMCYASGAPDKYINKLNALDALKYVEKLINSM